MKNMEFNTQNKAQFETEARVNESPANAQVKFHLW